MRLTFSTAWRMVTAALGPVAAAAKETTAGQAGCMWVRQSPSDEKAVGDCLDMARPSVGVTRSGSAGRRLEPPPQPLPKGPPGVRGAVPTIAPGPGRRRRRLG